jgi:hypothetical protein
MNRIPIASGAVLVCPFTLRNKTDLIFRSQQVGRQDRLSLRAKIDHPLTILVFHLVSSRNVAPHVAVTIDVRGPDHTNLFGTHPR